MAKVNRVETFLTVAKQTDGDIWRYDYILVFRVTLNLNFVQQISTRYR